MPEEYTRLRTEMPDGLEAYATPYHRLGILKTNAPNEEAIDEGLRKMGAEGFHGIVIDTRELEASALIPWLINRPFNKRYGDGKFPLEISYSGHEPSEVGNASGSPIIARRFRNTTGVLFGNLDDAVESMHNLLENPPEEEEIDPISIN